jgi:stage II sporulation protein AA (anti-sigma F factor antagonist)
MIAVEVYHSAAICASWETKNLTTINTVKLNNFTVIQKEKQRTCRGWKHKGEDGMEIQAKSTDRNLLLEFSGELDHHGAKNAIRDMERAIDAALPRRLVLDFQGVSFMDSSGIALILRAQQQMQHLEGSMMVCHVPPQAKRVLDAAGISRLVDIR